MTPKSQKQQAAFDKYAIFKTGGKQYQALEGKTIAIEKLNAQEGAAVELRSFT